MARKEVARAEVARAEVARAEVARAELLSHSSCSSLKAIPSDSSTSGTS